MRPGIIADDLTGACDSAARAAQAGWRPRVLLDPRASLSDLAVVSTATRSLPPEEAARVVEETARALMRRGVRPLFKKIDSTLRGPWAAEVASLRRVVNAELVAVAPAFPDCGRIVRDGVVYSDGVEIGALAPALDAAGVDGAGDALVIGDAENDDDLVAFVEKVAARGRSVLWVGSAGLARFAMGERADALPPMFSPAAPQAWLVVAGSTHPATAGQIKALGPSGKLVEQLPEKIEPGSAIFLIGGDTAERELRRLKAAAIDVYGEALPGVAIGWVVGGAANGVLCLTKAGGFGAANTVAEAIERIGRP